MNRRAFWQSLAAALSTVGLAATQPDAAARANLSLSGMKSRVQRARSQLRDALLQCCAIELDQRKQPIDMTCRRPDHCRDCG